MRTVSVSISARAATCCGLVGPKNSKIQPLGPFFASSHTRSRCSGVKFLITSGMNRSGSISLRRAQLVQAQVRKRIPKMRKLHPGERGANIPELAMWLDRRILRDYVTGKSQETALNGGGGGNRAHAIAERSEAIFVKSRRHRRRLLMGLDSPANQNHLGLPRNPSPAKDLGMVEAGGIEPPSQEQLLQTTTCVAFRLFSPWDPKKRGPPRPA